MLEKCVNIWVFLAIFCLCYCLETITYTYMISAISSIEKQFQIPSALAGGLVSANDIGYVLTVVFVAYIGSKCNRAQFIGGGCMLISFACLFICLPHFTFSHGAISTNISVIRSIFMPPGHLLDDNVTPEQILNYPPIRHSVSEGTYNMLMVKLQDNDEQLAFRHMLDYFDGRRYDEQFIGDGDKYSNSTDLETMQQKLWNQLTPMVIEVRLGTRNVSSFYNEAKTILKRELPDAMVQKLQRVAAMPLGYCNPIINRVKSKIADLKCSSEKTNDAALGMVFVGVILIGVGHSAPWSLGIPLVDDNVKKQNAPLLFAVVMFIRVLGPMLGFGIGSACSGLYYTLKNPGIAKTDVRWIGAWWLGFLIIAAALFVPSLLLFCFPSKAVPKTQKETETATSGEENMKHAQPDSGSKPEMINLVDVHKKKLSQSEKLSLLSEVKGFLKALCGILGSKVYTGALIGRVFDVFAFKGYVVFLPKYLESHFGILQSTANMYLGFVGVVCVAAGIVFGSFIMKRFKMEGRKIAVWVTVCSLFSSVMLLSEMALGCHSVVNRVGQIGQQKGFNFTSPCNDECNCASVSLFPVCDEAGNAFYSPCTAGCQNITIRDKKAMFSDCKCVNSTLAPSMTVSYRNCPDNCRVPLISYICLAALYSFSNGCIVVPAVLIEIRAVPPEFRSVALGFTSFIVSLLSTLPSPIVYGALIDGACLLWTNSCGTKGSCRIYDPQILRYKIHGFNSGLRLVGLLFHIWVIYWAKGLTILDIDTQTSTTTAEVAEPSQDQDKKSAENSREAKGGDSSNASSTDLGSADTQVVAGIEETVH